MSDNRKWAALFYVWGFAMLVIAAFCAWNGEGWRAYWGAVLGTIGCSCSVYLYLGTRK
jgi:CHASE2 domain-containing sensor protein